MPVHKPLEIESVVVGEDVIVINPSSFLHDKLCEIQSSKVRGEFQKVSVLFEDTVYSVSLKDLTLA